MLRWEPWTAGVIEYQVRWLFTSAPTPSGGDEPHGALLSAWVSMQDVEKAAGMIATLSNVVDEDGFRRPRGNLPGGSRNRSYP